MHAKSRIRATHIHSTGTAEKVLPRCEKKCYGQTLAKKTNLTTITLHLLSEYNTVL